MSTQIISVGGAAVETSDALAYLRAERNEHADPVCAIVDGHEAHECDGCYAALATNESEPGLWLCGACS